MKKTFSPSEAALSIFELTKRQPQFVLRFCILYAVGLMITYGVAGATGVGQAMIEYAAIAQKGQPVSPERITEIVSPAMSGFFIVSFLLLAFGAFTTAMGLRKAVFDTEQGLLGLQAGRDEINIFIGMILIGVMLFVATTLSFLIGGLVGGNSMAGATLTIVLALLVIGYVAIRFSQVGVMTIATGRVAVKESLSQTKGQVARFIGAFLLWFVIASILSTLAQALGMLGASAMGVKVGVGIPSSLAEFLKPGWLLFTLVYGLAGGFATLGGICVGAYAWHQMQGELPPPKSII